MCAYNTPVRQKNVLLDSKADKVTITPSRLFKRLGYGTGVDVYEMTRSPLNNAGRSPWAVKITTNRTTYEMGKRLRYEADVLRQLNHPNVVVFKTFTKSTDGKACLAMEECDFCLGDLIEDRREKELGPYDAKIILKVASDVAKALDYLHNEALILHCDIKSYNVLIKGNFLVCKLCDFGVALPLTKDGCVDTAKVGDEIEYVGTQAWFAPEVIGSSQIITSKADIYSFGLVLWEMLALCPPHSDLEISSCDLDKTIISISSDEGELPIQIRKRPDLPKEYEFGEEYGFVLEIFYCCTHEDMKLRPTAEDLVDILNKKSTN